MIAVKNQISCRWWVECSAERYMILGERGDGCQIVPLCERCKCYSGANNFPSVIPMEESVVKVDPLVDAQAYPAYAMLVAPS